MMKAIVKILSVLFVFACIACEKKEPEPKFSVGQEHEGGVIFYLDDSGEHGLIVTAGDQTGSALWGCAYTEIKGARGSAIGTGKANTADIIASCDSVIYNIDSIIKPLAAKICDTLKLNGYADWFLPSADEAIQLQKEDHWYLIGFAFNYYWTSTQTDSKFAKQMSSRYGGVSNDEKIMPNSVRCIRSF